MSIHPYSFFYPNSQHITKLRTSVLTEVLNFVMFLEYTRIASIILTELDKEAQEGSSDWY